MNKIFIIGTIISFALLASAFVLLFTTEEFCTGYVYEEFTHPNMTKYRIITNNYTMSFIECINWQKEIKKELYEKEFNKTYDEVNNYNSSFDNISLSISS